MTTDTGSDVNTNLRIDAMAVTLVSILLASRGDAVETTARLAAAQARADEVEPWLKAFTYRQPVGAAEAGVLAALPLAGLPVAIKDLMDTADMPTGYGSPIHDGHRPESDAWIVRRIREYGGAIFGKTVTTEFAWREPGPTVNPWHPGHTPGGSSSGSAAAVGAGIVPLATGTQTVGSVIRPAAFCGVVGYKPSYGKIPTEGVHPLAKTLDHVGFFARRVEDAALAHALFIDALPGAIESEQHWQDYFAAGVGRRGSADNTTSVRGATTERKFLVVRTPLWDNVSAPQQENFNACLDSLLAAGATLVEGDFDAMPAILEGVHTLLAVEANEAIGAKARAHPERLSAHMARLTQEGAAIPAEQYEAALALRQKLRDGFHAFLSGCDGILTIPAAGGAPEGLAYTGDASYCAPWSFLGVPAVTVPSGRTADGLPLGLQIVGDIDNDLATLQAAAWVETIVG